ncbi:MAG: YlxR family protein [Chloroflexi bacterium]|nr:YlxR family protein [Chloroflexota bacterium]
MPPRVRKSPVRTCVVCRQASEKSKMLRIVRGESGMVEVDLTGKKPGRGAYVCSRPECRGGSLAERQLARALGVAAVPGLD